MDTLHFKAPAKINLGLFIKGKRSDGYHLLETVLYPFDHLWDDLYITPSNGNTCELSIEGIELDGSSEDNLVVKAYHLLRSEIPSLAGVTVRLVKRIPAGAGLGGGSSDAATMLLALNELFSLSIPKARLAELAAKLGADVPFFLYQTPMLASGIGTELEDILFPSFPYEIRLITPPIHSSTVGAYKALDYTQFDHSRKLKEVIELPVDQWRIHLHNDLEVPIFLMYPELKDIKEQLYKEGAVYAAMSGSGSAVFGLFKIR